MSNCIKDLYDYDLIKKCSKCGIISLKSNFHKNKKYSDGLVSQCKCCLIQKQRIYESENRERINIRNKDYQLKNHDRIMAQKKIYTNNRYKTDIDYRLIRKTRSRIYKSLKGMTKQSSSINILGIDINLYRKWLEFQFTPEMNWDNIEIDHVKAICLFDVTKDEELREAFNWKNTQPLLKQDNRQKGTKFDFFDYQNQFIKAYQFIQLNEERFNENIH